MLTRLRIKNFKSLADTGDMDIRPLTFLVGPNSAGKSSVLQVLLMLRQTVDERDPNITLKINDSWVKLGSYLDCIHRAAGEELGSRELEIDFTFLALEHSYREDGSIQSFESLVDFNVQFGYDGEVFLQRASYGYGEEEEFTIEYGDSNIQPRKFYDYSRLSVPKRPEKERPEKGKPSQIDSIFVLSDEGPVAISSGFEELVWAMEFFFSNVFYLGPLRQRPELSYEASGEVPRDVGLSGERAMDVLIARNKKEDDTLITQVRHWLDIFDIASDVELIAHTPTLYEFRLTDKRTGVAVNYPHVGFGASQIVPIIVEGFYSPDHALLLVEQPEIHLHPRAQARLGDLLVDISQTSRTLIVETHSEHLLSQVQVRIAQGDVSREDVAIYYFEPTPAGTRVVPIEINELGQFVNWPAGFFDEGLKLADAHLQAITTAQGRGDGRD